jgi:uncharacterized membrane protein YjfL (UPF0719 family)
MDLTQFSTWAPLLSTLLYSVFGIIIFAISFVIMDKVTPFSFRKEIEEDQNISLGIIIGCVFIGLAIIIAAAIR